MSGDSSEPLNMLHDEALGESAKTSEGELGEQTTPPLRGTLRGESLHEPSKMLDECLLTKLALRPPLRGTLRGESLDESSKNVGRMPADQACATSGHCSACLRS